MDTKENEKKERVFQKDVCIIGGCGHVGLPLAIVLAYKGKNVSVYDINRENVERSKKGIIPFYEEGAEPLLKQVIRVFR